MKKKIVAAARNVMTVEYALMASLLAIVAFASMQILGSETFSSLFKMGSLG
jgi:hypothetical protein